ncbi:MAG: hypothetical protein TREMPRED_003987, partial [Tremellales sp. Tagirdzhanova-0007]
MLPSTYARGIPTYDSLSYSNFLHDHLIPNTPFLLSQSSTSRWRASKKWRVDTSSSGSTSISQPILSSLRPYAYHIVPIADTCVREYSEFARSERLLGDILDLWERGDGGELYVKDWHLPSAVEQEGRGVEEIYEVPEPFRDDWMNPAYSPSKTNPPQPQPNDFRFCYVGPPGTFTPLHRDVYASYSWSANIVGRKKWWLFPPDTLHSVRDTSGKLVFDVREMPDEGGGIKIVQQEGEVIYVPSGWYHQVVNLDFCISINHNFASSITLPSLYDTLAEAQCQVEESIADVKEMIQERLGSSTDA